MALKRTRLTNAEKEAGLTVDEKKRGITLDDKIKATTSKKRKTLREIGDEVIEQEKAKKREVRARKKELNNKADRARVLSMNGGTESTPTKNNAKEVIRVLGTDGTEKSVHDLILQELGKATWEWKEVPVDKDFRLSLLNKLGKDGWKFAFVRDFPISESQKKIPSIFLQRPRG